MRTAPAVRSLPLPLRRALLATGAAAMMVVGCDTPQPPGPPNEESAREQPRSPPVRVAAFNVKELSIAKLEGDDAGGQVDAAIAIIRRVRPDILLVNEIDAEPPNRAAELLRQRLADPARPELGALLDYAFAFSAPVNTGEPSGRDLNRDGAPDGPDDAWGFGRYPGQYGMTLLSRHPIQTDAVRTFRLLRWATLPGTLIPDGRDGRPDWYDPETAELLRLSSKSHWDVPVAIGDAVLHLIAAHPTPPVFDGDEDRNGRRNFDELRLVAEYLDGSSEAAWLVDDQGRAGPLEDGAHAVVLGDLNSDPFTAEPTYGATAIAQLLDHPRLQDPHPAAPGGHAAPRPYPAPERAGERTDDWGRLDYVLPTRELEVVDAGVFWPAEGAEADLADRASDHRLVWVDLRVPQP